MEKRGLEEVEPSTEDVGKPPSPLFGMSVRTEERKRKWIIVSRRISFM